MYIYIYIFNHENHVPSRLSPQWLCGNSCTWAHDVRLRQYKSEKNIHLLNGLFQKKSKRG